jgi:hypothetical protein
MRNATAFCCLPCFLHRVRCKFFPYFTVAHRKVLLWFYVAFALLTFLLLLQSVGEHGDGLREVVWASILSFAGPFTGPLVRGSSYGPPGLAFFCCVFFGGGLLFQIVPLPLGRMGRWMRIGIWCIGLMGWFPGALLSILSS